MNDDFNYYFVDLKYYHNIGQQTVSLGIVFCKQQFYIIKLKFNTFITAIPTTPTVPITIFFLVNNINYS